MWKDLNEGVGGSLGGNVHGVGVGGKVKLEWLLMWLVVVV